MNQSDAWQCSESQNRTRPVAIAENSTPTLRQSILSTIRGAAIARAFSTSIGFCGALRARGRDEDSRPRVQTERLVGHELCRTFQFEAGTCQEQFDFGRKKVPHAVRLAQLLNVAALLVRDLHAVVHVHTVLSRVKHRLRLAL